jgi:methyl-accepting chemotaxis protein
LKRDRGRGSGGIVEAQRAQLLRSILATTGVAMAAFTVLAAVFALVEEPDALALVPMVAVLGIVVVLCWLLAGRGYHALAAGFLVGAEVVAIGGLVLTLDTFDPAVLSALAIPVLTAVAVLPPVWVLIVAGASAAQVAGLAALLPGEYVATDAGMIATVTVIAGVLGWYVSVSHSRATLAAAREAGRALEANDALLARMDADGVARIRLEEAVERIGEFAARVAGGDLAARIELPAESAFSRLAQDLNAMAGRLAEARGALQATADDLRRAVQEQAAIAERVSQGDLAVEVTYAGEGDLGLLARSLGEMIQGLRTLTGRVQEAVEKAAGSVSAIQSLSRSQAGTLSQQTAASQQLLATVEEAARVMENAAATAAQVARSSREALSASDAGLSAVRESVQAMAGVQERVKAVVGLIARLAERSGRIGEVTAAVDAIASQSALLALNASIEAARAGEAGRGFAVVADEVRVLADESQQSTRQIASLLREIQQAVQEAVASSEAADGAVGVALDQTSAAGGAIEALTAGVRDAVDAGQRIQAAASEQAAAMEEIRRAVRGIDEATRASLEATRRAEEAAEELSKTSQRLRETAANYHL